MTAQPAFTRADPDARRLSLIRATARVLAQKGAAGVSVRAICAEAGVSPGLLRHYFGGVSEAIAETCHWTGQTIHDALAEAVAQAGSDPRARLLAYLSANFTPPIATPDLLASYVALWSLSLSDPAVAREREAVSADFRDGLAELVRAYRPALSDTALPVIGLTALVDGLWLELSLGHAPFSAREAKVLAERWVDGVLG